MNARLGMVVVAHNSSGVLGALLESVRTHEPDAQVLVVDSASPEGPPRVPDDVDLISLGDNVGYGAACNVGASELGTADHLVFLNPDVRLRGPSFSELAELTASRPRIGIAAPPLVDDDGRRIPSAWGPSSVMRKFAFAAGLRAPRSRRILTRLGHGSASTSGASVERDELRVEGHVLGGALLVTRDCWDQLGGFDPGFFLYGEDTDLCYRARQAGWEVWVLPVTPAVHVQGTSSSGVSDEQRRAWHLEGTRRFGEKHLGPVRRRLHVASLHAGNVVRRWRPSR